MPLPLDGVTVLDFSTLLPGPLAGFMLAEAGAEVIKIERAGGEDMRRFPPLTPSGSAAFAALNGGKRSLALDLRAPADRARLEPLLRRADIVIEQFRPGTMQRLGLDYAAVRTLNPRLVYCSISGYGQAGPRAGEAGHDLNYQAASGLLSLSPGTTEAPALPAALVADIAGGTMPAVMNILLALRQRDATGEGMHLDIAMADIGFTFSWLALAQGAASGRHPGAGETLLTGASPRYALYPTRDARFLAVAALEEKFWGAFCDVLDLPRDLRDDARDPARTRAGVARLVAAEDAAHWRRAFAGRDCCSTLVASLDEARADPHFAARGLFAVEATAAEGTRWPAAVVPIVPALRREAGARRAVPEADGGAFSGAESTPPQGHGVPRDPPA